MRMLRSRSRVWTWLAGGIVGVGVLAGGTWYASGQTAAPSLLYSLTRRASAQEAPPTAQPLAPARRAAQAAQPTVGNSKRPTGQVTAITSEPPTFTIQPPDGTTATYRVLTTTVFMAGHDRPYRFDLLKAGDTVVIRGGQGQAQNQGQAAAANPPKPRANQRAAARQATAGGELIARQVMVRPAGEGKPGVGAGRKMLPTSGQNTGAQTTGAGNGGSDAAGQ